MTEWTFYTLAEWWNPLAWTWWPEFEHYERRSIGTFLFFSVIREAL